MSLKIIYMVQRVPSERSGLVTGVGSSFVTWIIVREGGRGWGRSPSGTVGEQTPDRDVRTEKTCKGQSPEYVVPKQHRPRKVRRAVKKMRRRNQHSPEVRKADPTTKNDPGQKRLG